MDEQEYVVVLDDDSRARLLHLINADLARRTMNVTAGPLLRARDALAEAKPRIRLPELVDRGGPNPGSPFGI